MSTAAPTSAPTSAPRPSQSHRGRYLFQGVVLLFAATMIAALALFLLHDQRFSRRFDLTATRAHALSPQTASVLNDLIGPTKLVISANLRQTDAESRRRLEDVLDKFSRGSSKLSVQVIDTSSSAGLAQFDQLMQELVQAEKPLIDRYATAAASAIDTVDQTAIALDSTATLVERMSQALIDGVTADETLSANERTARVNELKNAGNSQSALLKEIASKLRQQRQLAADALGKKIDPIGVTDYPTAMQICRVSLQSVMPRLTQAAEQAERQARGEPAGLPAAVKDMSATLALLLSPARDRAARAIAAADSLPKLRVVTISSALQRTQAAILIGPPLKGASSGGGDASPDAGTLRITAVPIDELLPAPVAGPDGVVITPPDQRKRAEERLTAAMVAMTARPRPLVIFTHAEANKLAPAWGPWRKFIETLALRGIDADEWPTATQNAPPSIVNDAAKQGRPVVFLVLSQNASSTDSAVRVGTLAKAIENLIADGRSVLMTTDASPSRAAGATDALVAPLAQLGINVETGKPLMHQSQVQGRRIPTGLTQITSPHADHAISAAIDGLTLRLPWTLPIRFPGDGVSTAAPVTGVSYWPIARDPVAKETWAESEWQTLMRLSGDQMAMLPRPPAFDSPSDDDGGASAGKTENRFWTVALAAERKSGTGTQRLVVVGGTLWLVDPIASAEVNVDGRQALAFPGNWELAAASVNWLAGRDDLIARGSQADAVATIPNLSAAQLSAIRWGLTLGLPLLILLIGALWRLWRG